MEPEAPHGSMDSRYPHPLASLQYSTWITIPPSGASEIFQKKGKPKRHVLGWVALVHTISYHTPKKNDCSRISLYLFHSHSSSISQVPSPKFMVPIASPCPSLLKSPTSGSSSSVALHVTRSPLPPNFCGVRICEAALHYSNGQLILLRKQTGFQHPGTKFKSEDRNV